MQLQRLAGTAAFVWNSSFWQEQQILAGHAAFVWNSSFWLERQLLAGTAAFGWHGRFLRALDRKKCETNGQGANEYVDLLKIHITIIVIH